MIGVNRSYITRKIIGVILVGVGISVLVGILLYLAPHILGWLSVYPAWATFLVGLATFSLGVFLAVTEHIKSAKKAQETESNKYKGED